MSAARDKLTERREQIRRVVDEFRRRRQLGQPLDEAQLIAENPTLMPELGFALANPGRSEPTEIDTLCADLSDMNAANVSPSVSTAAAPHFTSPPPTSPLLSLHIPGYTLISEIYRGGQGVVFEGRQNATGQTVAIKVLRQGPLASAQEQARFDREAQVLAALHHPNIVCVVDRGRTAEGAFYLAMEFVSGRSLDVWLDDYFKQHPDGPPPSDPSELLRLFMKISDAVNAAHLRGVVHRDLKPSNIKIDDNGEPHVLDFGLAHVFMGTAAGENPQQPVTITGQFLGSLPWASPEQAEGLPGKIDFRTDVYSLGVILYQMLTAQFPYEVVGTMRDVLDNIMRAEPSPPSLVIEAKRARLAQAQRRRRQGERKINSAIDAIVLKALAKRREDRYQTAGELARDIGNYLAGRPTMAGGVAPPPTPWWRTAAIAGASLAVVALLSGVAVLAVDRWWRGGPAVAVANNAATEDETNLPAPPAPVEPPTHVATTPPVTPAPEGPPESTGPARVVKKETVPVERTEGLANTNEPASQVSPPSTVPPPLPAPGENDLNVPPPETIAKSVTPVIPAVTPSPEKPISPTEPPLSGPVSLKSWRLALNNSPTSVADKITWTNVAWSPDGKLLVAGGQRGGEAELTFFDTSLSGPVKTIRDNSPSTGLRWTAKRKLLVGLNTSGNAPVWTARGQTSLELAASFDSKAVATAAAWSPEGNRLVLGSSDGQLTYFDFPTGKIRHRLQVRGKAVRINALDWSADGKLIAVALAGDKQLDLFDLNGAPVGKLPGLSENMAALAFAPTSAVLAIAAPDAPFVEIWDARSGKLMSRFDARPGAYALQWSPDGARLAAACAPGEGANKTGSLALFNLGAESRLWNVDHIVTAAPAASPLAWSPDGRLIATAGGDHKLSVFDAQTGKPRAVLLSVGQSPPLPLAISPNGHFRGPKGVETELRYIATTTDGAQATLSAAEFQERFSVQNNPDSVSLAP